MQWTRHSRQLLWLVLQFFAQLEMMARDNEQDNLAHADFPTLQDVAAQNLILQER